MVDYLSKVSMLGSLIIIFWGKSSLIWDLIFYLWDPYSNLSKALLLQITRKYSKNQNDAVPIVFFLHRIRVFTPSNFPLFLSKFPNSKPSTHFEKWSTYSYQNPLETTTQTQKKIQQNFESTYWRNWKPFSGPR